MTIPHKSIPESGLHEPKGVSTAASDRVYVADGVGSGSWSLISADSLQGTINDGLAGNLRVITDGSGGFTTEPTPASSFGTLNLTDNTTTKSVTAASDSTLNTDSDFTPLDIALTAESLENMGSSSNSLVLQASGLYLIDFWANVSASVNGTKFSLKFVIDDTTFVARGPKTTLTTQNQIYNISANGLHSFTAGQEINLYIATSTTTDVTIEDMTFQLLYLGA